MKNGWVLGLTFLSWITSVFAAEPVDPQMLKPAPLGKIILSLLTPADPALPWSVGSGPDSPIRWSAGVQDDAQGNGAFRGGYARATIGGKELHNLRQTLEPVVWEIFVTSDSPQKFGPETISIQPKCDQVACTFPILGSLREAGIAWQKICAKESGGLSKDAYRISKGATSAFLVYETNFGSGGSSNDLEIILSGSAKGLCKIDS